MEDKFFFGGFSLHFTSDQRSTKIASDALDILHCRFEEIDLVLADFGLAKYEGNVHPSNKLPRKELHQKPQNFFTSRKRRGEDSAKVIGGTSYSYELMCVSLV
ncbi:hypothetical protein ACFE04_018590 [Oxalis oulophora]